MPAVCIASSSTFVKRKTQDVAVIDQIVASQLATHPWLWTKLILATKFSPGVKAAALALAQNIHRGRANCWTGHKQIGVECGQAERTVRKAMAKLRDNGLISVKRRGRTNTNEVYLALPPGLRVAPVTTARGTIRLEIEGEAILSTRAPAAAAKAAVTGPTSLSDRPAGATVTGPLGPTTYRGNYRTELRKEENKNHKPYLAETQNGAKSAIILDFKHAKTNRPPPASSGRQPTNQPVKTECLPRATSEERARRAIGRAAATDVLGWRLGDPPLPGGQFIDAAVLAALPPKTLAGLVKECLCGTLALPQIAAALSVAGIGPGSGLDRRRAA